MLSFETPPPVPNFAFACGLRLPYVAAVAGRFAADGAGPPPPSTRFFSARMALTTSMMFFSSKRSGVQKTSCSRIPSWRQPERNAEMFSICLNGIDDLFALILATPPTRFPSAFIALTRTVPSLSQHAKSPV